MIAAPSRSAGILLLVATVAVALGTRAAAQEEAAAQDEAAAHEEAEAPDDIDGRWLPSLALGFDVQVESEARASVLSTLRGATSGEREFLTAVPALEGELMTPVLAHQLGRPRLFLAAEWAWGWRVSGEERPVTVEGTVGGPVLIPPRCQPGNPTRCLVEDLSLVEGMGSRLDASIEDGWSAGVGMAFEVPVADSLALLVKPSFLYHGEVVEISGEVKDPFLIVGSSPPNDNTASYVQLVGSKNEVFHALGGRVAIEYAAARKGPFDVLVYIQGQIFWWLEPDTSFTVSDDGGTARFDYSRNDIVGGGGVGVRVRWRGP